MMKPIIAKKFEEDIINSYNSNDENSNQRASLTKKSKINYLKNSGESQIEMRKQHNDTFLKIRIKAENELINGNISEALAEYETMFGIQMKLYNIESDEYQAQMTEIIEQINKIAMKFISKKDTEKCLGILFKCDAWLKSGDYGYFPILRNLTINNLGCVYRRLNNPKQALKYLNYALEILEQANLTDYSSITYLNLSAVCSQIGDHVQAGQHAKNAIIYGQEELLTFQSNPSFNKGKFKEKVIFLAIAYHNMGVEEEFLNKIEAAITWYEKSCQILRENGINDEKLIAKFEKILFDAKEKLIANANALEPKTNNHRLDMKVPKRMINTQPLRTGSEDSLNGKPKLFNRTIEPGTNNNKKQKFYMSNNRIVSRRPTQSQSIKTGKTSPQVQMDSNTPEKNNENQHVNEKSIDRKHNDSYQSDLNQPSRYSESRGSKNNMKSINAATNPSINNFIQKSGHESPQNLKKSGLENSDDSKNNLIEELNTEENEIRELEKVGILQWSDDENQRGNKKMKKNRMDFLGNLQKLNHQTHDMKKSDEAGLNTSRKLNKEEINQCVLLLEENFKTKSNGQRKKLVDFQKENHMQSNEKSQAKELEEPTMLPNQNEIDAAVKIQSYYRMRICRRNYQLEQNKLKNSKILLIKNEMQISTIDKNNESVNHLYDICIYLEPHKKNILFLLKNMENDTQYEQNIIIDTKIPIINDHELDHPINKEIILKHIEGLLQFIRIKESVITFDGEKETKEISHDVNDNNNISKLADEKDSEELKEEIIVRKIMTKEEQLEKLKELEKEIQRQTEAALIIQKNYRQYKARENFRLIKNQKVKLEYLVACKYHEYYILLKIYQNIKRNIYFIKAVNSDSKECTNTLTLPKSLLKKIHGWSNVQKLIELFEDEFIIGFTTFANHLIQVTEQGDESQVYDAKKVIKIQAHWRGYQARKLYKLRLSKKIKNGELELITQKIISFEGHYIIISIYFHFKDDIFVVNGKDSLKKIQVKSIFVTHQRLDYDDHGKHKSKTRSLGYLLKKFVKGNIIIGFKKKNDAILELTINDAALDLCLNEKKNNGFKSQTKDIPNIKINNSNQDLKLSKSKSKLIENQLKNKEEVAAIRIQSHFRGYHARESLNKEIALFKKSLDQYSFIRLDGKAKLKRDKNLKIEKKAIYADSLVFSNLYKSISLEIYWLEVSQRDKKGDSKNYLELNIHYQPNNYCQITWLDPNKIKKKLEIEYLQSEIVTLLIDKLIYDPILRKIVFVSNLNENKQGNKSKEKHREEASAILIQTHFRKYMAMKRYLVLHMIIKKDVRFISKMLRKSGHLYIEISYYYIKSKDKIKISAKQIDDSHNTDQIYLDLKSMMSIDQYRAMKKYMKLRVLSESMLKEIFFPIIQKLQMYLGINHNPEEIAFELFVNIEACKLDLTRYEEVLNFRGLSSYDHSNNTTRFHDLLIDMTSKKVKEVEFGFNKPNYRYAESQEKSEERVDTESNIQNKEPQIDRKYQPHVIYTIVWCQKKFRAKRMEELFKLKFEKKRRQDMELKTYGKLIDKTIKKIDDTFYTICVYKANQHNEDHHEIYNFTVVPYKTIKNENNTAKGTYIVGNTDLLNTEGKSLTDFLISKLTIKNKAILFNLKSGNYVPLEEKPFISKFDESREENTIEDGQGTPIKSSPNITEGNKMFFKNMTMTTETNKKDPNVTENVLLQQRTEIPKDTNNICLYNIYYNTDLDTIGEGKKGYNDVLTSTFGNKFLQKTKRLADPTKKNYVKIDLDVNELRKFAPNINPKSTQDLLNIAFELAKSIQVANDGLILVDTEKLNPNCLDITEKNLIINNDAKPKEIESILFKTNDKRRVLGKTTKFFNDKKYLIVINLIERLIRNTNAFAITVGKIEDQVYEEYEILIEISALCLSEKNIDRSEKSTSKPILWELSLFEARTLLNLNYPNEITKFIIDHIMIYGNKFLLSTKKRVNYHNDNAMLIKESCIKEIQNRFKSKKFFKNYNKFQSQLKSLIKSKKLLGRNILSIQNFVLQIIAYEDENQKLQICAWELENYENFSLEILRETLPKNYNKYKAEYVKIIFNYIDIDFLENSQIGLKLKEKVLAEAIWKFESTNN